MATETTAMPQTKVSLWQRPFIIMCFANLFLFISFQMLMPIIPIYVEKELGFSESIAGMVVSVFTIASVIMRPIAGSVSDRYGRKPILMVGLILISVTIFFHSWAAGLAILMLLRVSHGIGWGVTSTIMGASTADVIPPSRMVAGMSAYGAFTAVAIAIAPLISIYLSQNYGYSTSFMLSTAIIWITIIMVAVVKFPHIAPPSQAKQKLYEKKSLPAASVIFFIALTYSTVVSFIALYCLNIGIAQAGLYFTCYAIFSIAIRPVVGAVSEKFGNDKVVVPALICMAIGDILLANLNGVPILLLASVFIAIGQGATYPVLLALAIKDVPANRRGAATSTFMSLFDIGMGVGAYLGGVLAEHFGFGNMYYIMVSASVVAFVLYWRLCRSKPLLASQ